MMMAFTRSMAARTKMHHTSVQNNICSSLFSFRMAYGEGHSCDKCLISTAELTLCIVDSRRTVSEASGRRHKAYSHQRSETTPKVLKPIIVAVPLVMEKPLLSSPLKEPSQSAQSVPESHEL